MRNGMFAMAAVCLSMLAGTAAAEITRPVRFTLPLSVTAGNAILPAGECTLDTVNTMTSTQVIAIRCAGNLVTVTPAMRIMTPDGRAAERTEVLLQNNNGQVSLHRVWIGGEAYGYELTAQ